MEDAIEPENMPISNSWRRAGRSPQRWFNSLIEELEIHILNIQDGIKPNTDDMMRLIEELKKMTPPE